VALGQFSAVDTGKNGGLSCTALRKAFNPKARIDWGPEKPILSARSKVLFGPRSATGHFRKSSVNEMAERVIFARLSDPQPVNKEKENGFHVSLENSN
jgi:hypothetical protein